MIKLEDLKKAGSLTKDDWLIKEESLNIILLTVGEVESILLYNLLFRLEGILYGKERVNIYLCDNEENVEKEQYIYGNYIEEDIGKNKVDVLIERYKNVFSTRLYKLSRERYMYAVENFKETGNVVIIGRGNERVDIDRMFNDFYNVREITGGLLGINGRLEGNTVGIDFKVARGYGDVIGGFTETGENEEKETIPDKLINNNFMAQMILMNLNILITDGLGKIQYVSKEYNTHTGKQRTSVVKDTVTIFHRYKIYGELGKMGIEVEKVADILHRMEEIEEIADEFILREVEKYKGVKKVAKLIQQYLDVWEYKIEAEIKKDNNEDVFYKIIHILNSNKHKIRDEMGKDWAYRFKIDYIILKMLEEKGDKILQ